jgi:O-antigen/teichoic acid export membrane protein
MYKHIKRLFSESSVYTVGNILQRSFSIITMPVYTRYMPVSEYGILAVVRTLKDLFGVIYEAGTSASSTRFYYECSDLQEQKRLFSTLFFFTLGFSLLASLSLVTLGAPLWNLFIKDIPFYPYGPLAIFTVLMGVSGILPRALFRVMGRAKLYVMLNLVAMALLVTSGVVTVVVFKTGALGPIASGFGVTIIFFFVNLYYLRDYLSFSFSWEIVRKSLAFGLPDSPVRFGQWALRMANQLVLQYYASLSLVGIYSVGYSVGGILFELVISGVQSAVLPFYYRTFKEEPEERAKEIFGYVATYNLLLVLFLALLTIFLGKELLVLFASSKYASAQSIVLIIAVASMFQYLFYIPSRSLYVMNKTVYLLPLLLVTVVTVFLFSFLLIPKYGIMGAAWSTLIAYFVRILLTLIVSQRVYYIPYQYLRMAKSVFAFAIVLIIGRYLPDCHILLLIPLKSLVLGLYPILLYLLGYFEKREIERIRWQYAALIQHLFSRSILKKAET